MEIQLDPERMQLREEADEILQTAAEPIDAPGHDDIELATGSVAVEAVKGGPAVAALRPGDTVVGVDLNHLMPHAGRGLGELSSWRSVDWSSVDTRRYRAARIA